MLYIPLPKAQVGESKGTHRALAETKEVMLIADQAPSDSSEPGFMSRPEAGFTDRVFGNAPRITLLPEAAAQKLVVHGERLLIVDTDSPKRPISLRDTLETGALPVPPVDLTRLPVDKVSLRD